MTGAQILRKMSTDFKRKTSEKNERRFDLVEIILKFKKMNRALHTRSQITREDMKSDRNMGICTKRYKR